MNLKDKHTSTLSESNLRKSLAQQISEKLKQEEERLSISSPADWIEENVYIPETRDDPVLQGRLGLQPYQYDCVNEALSKDPETGLYKYSIIVWSDIKKSIKSTIAAAVALHESEKPWGETYLIANDLKQADSRVAYYVRRAVQLSPTLKHRYRTRGYSIIGNNGSRIEALPIDPEGEAGSNADMIQFCLDEETEVLTHRGWKRYNDLLMTDAFATQNPETGKFEWQIAKDVYIDDYEGEMWEYETKRLSMKITPNHRVYGKFSGGPGRSGKSEGKNERYNELDWEMLPIEEALKWRHFWVRTRSDGFDGVEGYINTHFHLDYGKSKKIGPFSMFLWARFMGWYLSEGCIKRKGQKPEAIMIGQSPEENPGYFKEIWEMLEEMGLRPTKWKGTDAIIAHHTALAEYCSQFGLSGEKFIPRYLKNQPRYVLDAFISAYYRGDGYKVTDDLRALSTKSIKMRDDLIEVLQKCGYQVTCNEWADKRWEGNPKIYTVLFNNGKSRRKIKANPKKWKKVPYKGIVYCPSTKNGIIYVRRNGTMYWTGNSELWGAQDDAKSRMFTEMTLSPTKFAKSFRWIESYAGYMEESLILYNLWELGVMKGELLWPDRLYDVTEGEPTVLEAYANPEARMFCLWNTQPRCPWQTSEYYDSERAILHPLEFERMHRNQWITQTTTFVPMEWWDACQKSPDEWPEIPANHPMIMAADAGTMKDNFGVILCCNHPDKANYPDDILVWYARKWVPPKGSRGLDFVGTDENPGPEMEIRRLIAERNIIQLAYDEYQLHDMMNRLRKDGIVWCRRFPQGSGKHSRTVADAALYDKIRDRKIWHRGEPELREHIQNANAKIDDQERRLRIVKRVEHLKIDLAVGLSMAAYEVERLNL